jgi:hypothetical protein
MEDRKYIPDYETGYPIEVSKECFEEYHRMWGFYQPRLLYTEGVGRVVVLGTPGGLEMKEYEKLFLTNEQQRGET